jgi:LacI family transcriptional regulator
VAATIKDVAKKARVSLATVSRALNGHASVTDATRARVVETARRLNYVPHSAARMLVTRRTQTIGALLPDLYGEFFSELIRGIDLAARRRGFHLLLSSAHGDEAEATAAMRAMLGRVDGMLIMSPHLDGGTLAEALPVGVPKVLLNTRLRQARYSALSIDNHGGALTMVRHLASLGHKRIVHLTGPEPNVDTRERLRGYQDAMARLLPKQKPEIIHGDFSEESGYQAGRRILGRAQRPDAVFAANDMMAIGCLFAFTEAGLNVPKDIAVVGFDDIPIARFVTPPLTTVRVRIADLGGQAFDLLADSILSPDTTVARILTLDTELVVRASCGGNRRARGTDADPKKKTTTATTGKSRRKSPKPVSGEESNP